MNNNTKVEEEKLYEPVENNGIPTFKFKCWNDFFIYINHHMGIYDADFVWRGQANSAWEIESSLKRYNTNSFHHLLNFKNAVAGLTKTSFKIDDGEKNAEKERLKLWSLGQHFGLATPLIDWTQFPFVAIFFAFHEETDKVSPQEYRAIYALHMSNTRKKNYDIFHGGAMGMDYFSKSIRHPPYPDKFIEELIARFNFDESLKAELQKSKHLPQKTIELLIRWHKDSLDKKMLRLYVPESNENYRVYNQGGLFCYTPDDMSVEKWVRENIKTELDKSILRKFLVPNSERKKILKALNKMRVNYLGLFPDFEGAAKYCNMALKERDTTLSSIRPY